MGCMLKKKIEERKKIRLFGEMAAPGPEKEIHETKLNLPVILKNQEAH